MTYVISYQRDCSCWRETAPLVGLAAVNAKIAELLRWGVTGLQIAEVGE